MIFVIFQFVFVAPDVTSSTTVHEEMSRHLPTLLRPANTDFLVINKFMHHSNFFFEIMVKSMAQHLLSTGRIKVSTDFALLTMKHIVTVLFCPLLPVSWMIFAYFEASPTLCIFPPDKSSFKVTNGAVGQFQWLRSRRHGPAAACILGLWVRIPPGAWMCLLWVLCVVR